MSLILREEKGSKLTIQEMDGNLTYLESIGLAGTNYLFVPANGTDIENAAQLQAAYNQAKTMGATSSNPITVIAAPGKYKFPVGGFTLDTEWINLVSLDGNRSVEIDLDVEDPWQFDLDTYIPYDSIYGLRIYANNVFVKGMVGATRFSPNMDNWWGENYVYISFDIGDDLPSTTIENCLGGPMSFATLTYYGDLIDPLSKTVSSKFVNCDGSYYSFGDGCIASGHFDSCRIIPSPNSQYSADGGFGVSGIASGTFINCSANSASFACKGVASGTFIGCTSGINSFGSFGDGTSGIFVDCSGGDRCFAGYSSEASSSNISGTFNNCIAGDNSFGGEGIEVSGTFNNCIAGDNSFGSYFSTISGTFNNCVAGSYSFGSSFSTSSGTFINCSAGDVSFGSLNSTGTFTNCKSTFSSFGGDGLASGVFDNCISGAGSFGKISSGTFISCRSGDGSFGFTSEGEASGTYIKCISGDNSFGAPYIASGVFNYCIGGAGSFGGLVGATLSGKLYFCRLTSGTFKTVSTGGITRLCIDGTNTLNNQG